VHLGEFWGSPVNGVTYYLRTCVGVRCLGLGQGRGVWEEGKGRGARYYLSRYPNYLRAPKLTIERLVIGLKRVPSKLLTKGGLVNCSLGTKGTAQEIP
jgi:hypothetical protein